MRAITGALFTAIGFIAASVYAKPPTTFYSNGNPEATIGPSHGASSLKAGGQVGNPLGPGRRFGRLDLTHGKNNPDAPGVITIPHWSDSFTYNGLVYKYTMVGTDPKKSSATTVIPTVLIPIRFVFADGNVFDASTDIVEG